MANLVKHTFAALFIALALAPPSTEAREPQIGIDGCATLAALVYTELSREERSVARIPGRVFTHPHGDEVTVCNRTAHAVTRAFSESMRRQQIYVSWGRYNQGNGDYCQSHYLDQCYPTDSLGFPPMSSIQSAQVQESWRAITKALAPTLTYGVDGDVARFGNRDLELGLRHSLRRKGKPAR